MARSTPTPPARPARHLCADLTQAPGLPFADPLPDAQAPQCILLAVPARRDTTTWSYADLAATVTAARDLAHIRGVDYADLPAPARLVLPSIYAILQRKASITSPSLNPMDPGSRYYEAQ